MNSEEILHSFDEKFPFEDNEMLYDIPSKDIKAFIKKAIAGTERDTERRVAQEIMSATEQELKQEIASIIANSCGTEKYYKHWLGFRYTDGMHAIAETGAYWLIDLIGSYQRACSGADFQCWTLVNKNCPNKAEIQNSLPTLFKKNSTAEAIVLCTDGNGHIMHKQILRMCSIPNDKVRMYLIDRVLMLRGEY